MLKKISIKKISLATVSLFAILMLYLYPDNTIDLKEEIEYREDTITHEVFLLDKNNYVALTDIEVNTKKTESLAKELLNALIKGNSDKIKPGFAGIIPPNTEINSLKYSDGLIKVDFSKELLNTTKELEEKTIEAIIYTLTSIENVNRIIIYVDGDILTKLPKTKINLPSTLDRTYGINKEYEFTSLEDISKVTVYYVNNINKTEYYVPVTKYLNDNRDKLSIIISELSNGNYYNNNLMSYMNSNTQLVSSTKNNDILNLNFNSYIFDNVTSKEILEEVVYTVGLSICDNYNKNVTFNVDKKEVNKFEKCR